MLPDFVADVHPLVGISPDALYAAGKMARHSRDDCSVSGPQILPGGSAQTHNKYSASGFFAGGYQ